MNMKSLQLIHGHLSRLSTILLFLFVINAFFIGFVSAKRRRRASGIIRLNVTNKIAELKCKKREQIMNITIRGHDPNDCQGVPSHMAVDKCNCYWTNKCSLKFDPTDYVIPTSRGSCISRRIDALDISYSCKPADKISLFHDTKWHRKEGILRSHMGFPWDDHIPLTSTTRSMNVGLRNRLVVTLFPYDLGLNQLSIGNHTFTGQSSQPMTVVINRETVVYLKLIANDTDLNSKGFALCYKVLKMKTSYNNETACELIKSRREAMGACLSSDARRYQGKFDFATSTVILLVAAPPSAYWQTWDIFTSSIITSIKYENCGKKRGQKKQKNGKKNQKSNTRKGRKRKNRRSKTKPETT